jgi:hypothetical protein
LERAGRKRLDRVDFSDRPSKPLRTTRTAAELEDQVVRLRRELKERSDLGLYGAQAIHEALRRTGSPQIPSVRTIGRILERRGALDARSRVRRPAPPLGWYLPAVACGQAEVDSFDIVEGLVIRGGTDVEVLNAVSLHGGLAQSWPARQITAKLTFCALFEHWSQVGLPEFAQFDNDTIFQGAHQFPDSFGRVTRLCLNLGVTPVFVPPREPGFQAAIESYNGLWQKKVWQRFEHPNLLSLQQCSSRFVAALRLKRLLRLERAPERRSFSPNCQVGLQTPLRGRVIYLRRTTAEGWVHLLGHRLLIDPQWTHRLVRCEVLLSEGLIRFYALRRRTPTVQPLLNELSYQPPTRRFSG